MGSLVCARDLAQLQNISAPIVLLTDNSLLREMVAAGFFQGVVGPKVTTHGLWFPAPCTLVADHHTPAVCCQCSECS